VAVRVKGQRSKKHQWAIRCFLYPALFQTGFVWLGVQPIRFRGAGSSANQVSRGLGIQPIRFQRPLNSANQVSEASQLSQSGLEGWKFCQSGFEGWVFSQSHVFGVPVSSNQVFRNSEIRKSDGSTVIYDIRKSAVLLSSPGSMACGKRTSP